MASRKLYCYLDETGQDTKGELFIVAVVIPENRDNFLRYIEELEILSGKEKFKWGKADPVKRFCYLEALFTKENFFLKRFFLIINILRIINL